MSFEAVEKVALSKAKSDLRGYIHLPDVYNLLMPRLIAYETVSGVPVPRFYSSLASCRPSFHRKLNALLLPFNMLMVVASASTTC